jgi:glycerol-3-phosphate dehydrogenase (NAD(P)+)
MTNPKAGSPVETDKHESKAPIAVLGAGSWGTALAMLIARNGRRTYLWGQDAARMANMAHERENLRYLPGIKLPDQLQIREDLSELLTVTNRFLVAVPSHGFRHLLKHLHDGLQTGSTLAWATKGLEPGSGKLLGEVVLEELDDTVSRAVVSGPTFAKEVANNLPTALTVAADTPEVSEEVADWLHSDRIRVYTSDDINGVQLGGAIKNVLAVAAGISDGLGFGANARAALITRGLAELTRLGVAMGGKAETFMGLTGAGDLILTCTDDQSRNRRVGIGLGQGRSLTEILGDIDQEAEGVATSRELYHLAKSLGVDMPITEQVYRVIHENLSPQEAVEALLSRDSKPEI